MLKKLGEKTENVTDQTFTQFLFRILIKNLQVIWNIYICNLKSMHKSSGIILQKRDQSFSFKCNKQAKY